MEEDTLRLIIRRKLAQGDLPHGGIPRFWGGPANGEECDACEETITTAQFIMEGISVATNLGLQLHVECFYLWDEERDAPLRQRPTGSDHQPSRQSPGGTVVLHIDRLPDADPNSAEYSVSFRDQGAMGDTLRSKVQGLEALRAFLQKLNFTGPATQTVCAIVTDRTFHEIAGVTLTPGLIRELGL